MSEDINVTDGTVLECLNNKVDLDGGNYPGSGLEEIIGKRVTQLVAESGKHLVVQSLPTELEEDTFYYIPEA